MSSLASCCIWQCGLIWACISTNLASFKMAQLEKQHLNRFHPTADARHRLLTKTYGGEKCTTAGCPASRMRCFHLNVSGTFTRAMYAILSLFQCTNTDFGQTDTAGGSGSEQKRKYPYEQNSPRSFFFSLWHHRVLFTNVIADIKSNASAYAKSGYSSCHFKLICQLYDARIHVALSLKNLQHSCCLKLKHSFRGSVFHLESIWTSGEPTWRSTLLSEKDPVCALAGGLIASSVEWQLLKGFF